MIKKSLYTLFILLLGNVISGQNFWTPVHESAIQLRSGDYREVIPDKYTTYQFNIDAAKAYLMNAPEEKTFIERGTAYTFALPGLDGKMEDYMVWNSPVMEDELAARYPFIQSYKGYKKDEKSTTIRITIGQNSFHAAIRSTESMVYIDPYSHDTGKYFMVYNTKDYTEDFLKDKVICATDDDLLAKEAKNRSGLGSRNPTSGTLEFRKFRLALGCTGEWGQKRGTKEKIIEEMVIFVDRANVYFESEIAARMVLINNLENIINLDPATDPYTNANAGLSLVRQNTNVFNSRIGSGSYDMGHLFSVCTDVGGVAAGLICTDSGRGAGVTCHNGSSATNGIVLVFVHEAGHQMTAAHTFNHCPGQEGQTPIGNGFEPGSGSTIMAYPGACGSSNLSLYRDDYYHGATLDQILRYTATEGTDGYVCAEKIDIGNYVPEVTLDYINDFYIPKSTPFFLTGKVTDANGDPMTYNWEQFDAQGSAPLGMPVGNVPLFRSVRPNNDPTRLFPNRNRILNWEFDNVQELLPTYQRDMTFRLVTRDNNPLGSAASWAEMKFKVAPESVGPFQFTEPSSPQKLKIAEKLNVQWDVNNTDIAPVNCKYVDIFFAVNNNLDFGSTDMVPAAIQVPNTGSASIITPNVTASRARIVIKASDNIFFTVSRVDSKIDEPDQPSFFMDIQSPTRTLCLPASPEFDLTTAGFAGLEEDIIFEAESQGFIHPIFEKQSVKPGASNKLTLDLSDVKESGEYEVLIRSFVPGIDTLERIVRLILTSTDLSDVQLAQPSNGISGLGPTQKYHWHKKNDATGYILQVATSPAFGQKDIVFQEERQDTFYNSSYFLDNSTIYYWRIKSFNSCDEGSWSDIFAFTTESKNCSVTKSGELTLNISQSGTPTITSELFVTADARIDDVNIKNLRARHTRSADLVVTLESPSGTKVRLWTRKCPTANGINIGLDDQSNDYFQCPIHLNNIYRPEEPLSTFNGESTFGYWKLIIEDTKTGDGGRLTNWEIELCANVALNPPALVNNNSLNINTGDTQPITVDLLKSEDQDNGDAELIYTLVTIPAEGVLMINGYPAQVGNEFTQQDINEGKLTYWNSQARKAGDAFKFTVRDNNGGWIGITTFNIDIQQVVSTEDAVFPTIIVYPNPASDIIHIQTASDVTITSFTITDITGKSILNHSASGNHISIDASQLSSGIYMIRIKAGDYMVTKKLVKN
ncbi:MAG: T9SS type A sorting domain-containing protein [Saprospiraceae bacterium]|nr:MAG: Proprotein convertase P [Bacteroidetes bacterium OLB9]MCO6463981.1 T9SS type A sorting domain-containing protein [Saprospiraceae bacterium]MCZ2339448.1 M12 family metallo-peptidase [Chitinophagales bacterium]